MQEGQIVRNKKTGQMGRVVNGQVVPMATNQPTRDPRIDPAVRQAQAATDRTRVQTQVDAQTAPTTVQTNQAPAGFMWVDPSDPTQGVARIPGYETPSERKTVDPMKLAQFKALESQIARVQELYKKGPGSTSGALAVKDYLPSDANSSFDSAAAGLGEVGMAAFRVPGLGSQSDTELGQFIAANTPSASDRDAAIREKLGNLKRRLAATKEAMGLGSGASQETPKAAGVGATDVAGQLPEGFQGSYDVIVGRLKDGTLTPEQYAAFRVQQDRDNFGESAQDQHGVYLEEGYQLQKAFEAGIAPDTTIPPPNQTLSDGEQIWNDIAASPIGTGAVNFADSATLGSVSLLDGDKMSAASNLNPNSAMAGQMAGAIAGTAGLGKLGATAASKIAPNMLSGGTRAQFGRNIATDATYSGIYGTNTGLDPLESVALGTIGSGVGQGVGRTLGAAVGGVKTSPAVQALREKGVRLTAGRALGDATSRAEDLMQSVPLVGGQIRARQGDSFADFNQAAFREGGSPIGFSPTRVGQEGIEQFTEEVGRSYDSATAGVDIPVDTRFDDALTQTALRRHQLPDDLQPRFDRLMENHTAPISQTGRITGDQYQRAIRGLKMARGKAGTVAGEFEQPYREAVTSAMDAFEGQMLRAGGDDVIANLGKANAANKNLKILENASLDKAKVGTQTGQVGVFTPSQLVGAARASEKKYGPSALKALGEQGQEVLPSTVPNSGSTDRALAAAALGATGLGGGEYATQGNVDGTMTLASIAGMLAAMGTRGGQSAINKVLLDRPELLQQAGNQIRKRQGLFGSASVPLILNAQ